MNIGNAVKKNGLYGKTMEQEEDGMFYGKSVKRGITLVTVVCFFSFCVFSPVYGADYDLMDDTGGTRMVGVSFSGNFDFSSFSINGFYLSPVKSLRGSTPENGRTFISIDNGVIKTSQPLLTFGKDVEYPGLFYNHTGAGFHNLITRAAQGEESAWTSLWPYILGGAVIIGGIALIASNSGGDDGEPDTYTSDSDTGSGTDSSSSSSSSSDNTGTDTSSSSSSDTNTDTSSR